MLIFLDDKMSDEVFEHLIEQTVTWNMDIFRTSEARIVKAVLEN